MHGARPPSRSGDPRAVAAPLYRGAPRLQAIAALLRVGVLEAIAYRGEVLVWMLTTTMPLVMLALFGAVAREGAIGRYGEPQLVAYFLATFIVRQLTSSWVSWQINAEVRDGTLATRLLRPVHPLYAYGAESAASIPMRAAIALPVAVVLLFTAGPSQLAHDPVVWLLWAVSLAGAFLLSLFVAFAIGALAFFLEQSTKVMDVWLAFFFVFSGYLVPVDLFPPAVRGALDWLPFRYQIGLSVELMTGAHGAAAGAALVARQWGFVALAALAAVLLWRRGLGRFAAHGG
jgi:ABC-2 type transport system permease protein